MSQASANQLDQHHLQRVRNVPRSAAIVPDLFTCATDSVEVSEFLRRALPIVTRELRLPYIAVFGHDFGEWQVMASSGESPGAAPAELLSEALDRESELRQGDWIVSPLRSQTGEGELLLARGADASEDQTEAVLALAPVIGQAIASVRVRELQSRRIRRLEAILEIAGQWNKMHEMEPLLTQMAEAATRLLGADRASVFLWDRPNKTLVGRPALGVENNELRIADDAGVVGQVVQTGETRRVDAEHGQHDINRKVDRSLGYQTNNLLCVPLRGQDGELFGAFEVINKLQGNFTTDDEDALEEMAGHAAIALENTKERKQLLDSRRQMTEQAAEGVRLIGESAAVVALRSTIRRVAATDLAVLILGENGTGKEVVAQSIHYQGARRDQACIAVNCAAISETLLESELFGHEKGAFTGADQMRQGKFELASGGTLFLDEIGDMSPGGQAKLLRVLEEKVIVRVGGAAPIHTDARVIAATNQDLQKMVREKRFREDLYFRLNVVTLDLPPLRERDDDVVLLAEHFLRDFSPRVPRKPPTLSDGARRRLRRHTWPGNVRELRNVMERLAYLFPGDTVEAEDLSFSLSPADEAPAWVSSDLPLADATTKFQSDYIKKAVSRAKGNMSEAAKCLGLHRSNLYRKMRQLGMATDED